MNRYRHIWDIVSMVLVVAAAIVLGIAILIGRGRSNGPSVAEELGERVERRLQVLDGYIDKALEADSNTWMDLPGLPEDMVVYRYLADTLQSWANQFPIRSDDIRARTLVQRLGDSRNALSSPLRDATAAWQFVNLGPKWYLLKRVDGEGCSVIAGLVLVNELQAGSMNGVNRHFKVDDRFSLRPISNGVGIPVTVGGTPLFKLTSETLAEPSQRHSALLWLAVALLLAGTLVFLPGHPRLPWMALVMAIQLGLLCWLYFYGRHLSQTSQLFSPLLYADGNFFYSLGAVILVNLSITLAVVDVYLIRWTLLRDIRQRNSRALEAGLAAGGLLLTAGIAFYLHLSFRSILVNSNINLELYKIGLLTSYSGLVYLSHLALSLTLPILLQLVSPLLRSLFGLRYNMFCARGRLLYAIVMGIYFVSASATLGFDKEQRRVDVWANRLAMDRDIALEIQLRGVEGSIAADPVMGALSLLDGATDLLQSRLVSTYMSRIAQDYDIAVVPGTDASANLLFQDRIRGGSRLGENSHFFYNSGGNGRTYYTGLFSYYLHNRGVSTILITVESKHNREDRGYLSLLGISDPGRVSLPPVYSWAKYSHERLVQYKGAYPYPTVYSGDLKQLAQQRPDGHVELEGWCNFVHDVSEDELIIISRPSTEWIYYVVEGVLLAIIAYFFLTVLVWRKRRSGTRRYYQTRIGLVVYISLLLTLVAMAGFSVWFVYKRNDADMQSIMTSRINTLQSMLQEHLRQVEGPSDIGRPDVLASVEAVGNNLKCDITLFDTGGRVVMSTTPEVYDRMILGQRLNHRAYKQIRFRYERFFINREKVSRRSYYALYAPIFNSGGRMVAIVSSPFTDLSQNLETEAILHIATVITIFLLLLMLSRFITSEVVKRLFQPITEIRRRMTVTDLDHLEPIVYEQDDEITPLVQAYNRMVGDLGESTRRLAQVERDKAWTDMARRVAHDLKNPLTPIKLQLQMLMRMKQTGNPAWEDRFDEVATTVLYHVDLLADSADQFSTFAKMYDQKPERLDLDALMRQEVDLFDSRDDLQLDYFGLADAWVVAPRPQLTRVVVNLLTNAIQAVEENEGEKKLLVAVRNATEDGFYEIVVEDNGPGVAEQNQDKIFTPDFTTKTSGSGLGLAICRRIAEHCGGSISYSRSFTLGGACFTVKYPKE